MKRKIGKILIPTLILMLLFGTAAVWYFAQPAEATPIGDVRERLGSFTGPTSGTEQDDNVKASLDLIHDIIGDPGLIAGQTYAVSMTSLMIDDDMFTVAGGSILITSLVGEITTVSQTQANAIEIVLDADNTFDHDFTTAVETSGDLDGDRYVFDATATESVLTPCTGADGGSAGTMVHWYCSAGVIEINAAQAAHTGAIKWFMTFIPLEEGVTVTPM